MSRFQSHFRKWKDTTLFLKTYLRVKKRKFETWILKITTLKLENTTNCPQHGPNALQIVSNEPLCENGNSGWISLNISFKNGNSVKWKFGTFFFTKPPEMEFHFIAKALYPTFFHWTFEVLNLIIVFSHTLCTWDN